ncbi:unnamed protein product [Allacma fusca]|uniref:AAA+ ATPase domain-containing protein n=1 Tax=Allacma fusca TaxID=39272 RepID=A0A8J2M9J3_9HEXA|nr:unnamed protein product [Allacma fusca]
MVLKHVVLTGPPGVGKTTLVQKVCKALESKSIPICGFVTQEVREHGQRIGFQIITMDGKVGTLSSVKSKIGMYGVELQEFESVALPIFQKEPQPGSILIIDEIGKMEMFSKRFQVAVREAFTSDLTILATIPIPKGKPIALVEEVRQNPNSKLFQIDRSNRNTVLLDILKILCPNAEVNA